MIRKTTLAALTALLAGCTTESTTSAPSSTSSSGAADPNAEPGQDPGTPASSSGTPGETTKAGPCPSLAGPVTVGTRWEWAGSTTTNGLTSTSKTTSTVTSASETAAGFVMETKASMETTFSTGSSTSTIVSRWRCDAEGMWLVGTTTDQVTVTTGGTFPSKTETVYEGKGALSLVAKATTGSSWTSDYRGASTTSGKTTPFAFSSTTTLGATTSVTVKAGTFTAFEGTQVTTTGQGAPTSQKVWYADGVGMVKSSYNELVAKSF